jgi:hypothetical protein
LAENLNHCNRKDLREFPQNIRLLRKRTIIEVEGVV